MAKIYTDYHKMVAIQPRSYACQFLDHELEIDGNIHKAEWQAVAFSERFLDIEGDAKPEPYYISRIKMRWSQNYWYFCAELEEPQVWAKLREKNSVIFYDNDFEIFIDPDGDNINYYEFEMNAFNTIWELNLPFPYKDAASPINPYNLPGLKSAVQVQGTINDSSSRDQSWTLEVAIPWEGLKSFHRKKHSVPQAGDYWRVNFSRVQWDTTIVDGQIEKIPNRPEHNWVWSPQGVIDMHRPENWGFAYFVAEGCGVPENPLAAQEALKQLAMELYYLQRGFLEQEGCYKGSAECKEHLSSAAAAALQELMLLPAGANSSRPGFLAKLFDPKAETTVFINHYSQLIF